MKDSEIGRKDAEVLRMFTLLQDQIMELHNVTVPHGREEKIEKAADMVRKILARAVNEYESRMGKDLWNAQ